MMIRAFVRPLAMTMVIVAGLSAQATVKKPLYEFVADFSTKSAVVAPLSSKIGIKVAYLINYNNAPPVKPASTERFKKFDGLLTTGMQFTY